jgi:RND family efflux transporter MFP subunit
MSEGTTESGGAAAAGAAGLAIDRTRPRRRRGGAAWLLGAAVVVTVVLVAGSLLGRATGLLGGAKVRETRAVRESATLDAERTTASGYVVARTRASISPKHPGKLVRILVDVGDRVEKDQLLAEMDHAELDAALERARADEARAAAEIEVAERVAAERAAAVDGARAATAAARTALLEAEVRRDDAVREADRAERLDAEKVGTRSEADRAKALADIAGAQVARARAALDAAGVEEIRALRDAEAAAARVPAARAAHASVAATRKETESRREDANIRATFAGRVLRKEAEVGEVIAPASTGGGSTRGALLTLADFETLEMEVDVFERDVARVEEGAPARIVLDAFAKEPLPGRTRQVVPTADRQKATVRVKVAFDRPDPRVLPDMGGKVVFLAPGTKAAGEPDRVVVPAGAVVERGGRRGVFLVVKESDDRRAKFATVEAGAPAEGRVVVAKGLEGGESLVLDPPPSLADGDLVTVVDGP